MSEERLIRIEEKVDGIEAKVHGVEEKIGQIEEKLDDLRSGQSDLRANIDELQAGHMSLDRRLTRVEVSVEALRDDVKLIAEGHGATQAAIERAKDAIVAHIDRRIEPLERALKGHLAAS